MQEIRKQRTLNFLKKWLGALFKASVVILTIAVCISFLGPTDYQVQGVSFKVYVKPSLDGRSHLKLIPLGELSADTHRGPVNFFVELTEIHPDIIEEGFSIVSSQEEWINGIQEEAKKHLALFLLKQVLVGAAGGAVVYWIIFRPRWKGALAVFLLSLGLAGSALGYCAATFNVDAFKQPQYKGVVAAGPEILQLADNLYDKFMTFQDKTDEVVTSINTLFSTLESLETDNTPRDEETQILIVSDISNNPIGIKLVETLAKSFGVDFIIDAGDLTDFGSPVEAQAFKKIGSLGVPYLFAPGNHDSPEVTAFLRQFPNVRILEGEPVETKGLTVLGVPDPWASGTTVNGNSEAEIRSELEKQANILKTKLEANKDVDIAVIHNPTMVKTIEGLAPVIISGHTHKLSVKKSGGSFLLNPGTTGASGFRGFQAEEMSYSALILHLGKDTNNAVLDIIDYDPLSSSITTQRRVLQ